MGWLLVVFGVLLVAAGVLGTRLVASDNLVAGPLRTVYHGSQVAVSGPALLAYRGRTVRITAENPDGAVFIGVANPVDVASLTSGVMTYTVEKSNRSGLSGSLADAAAAAPKADPGTLDIWSVRVSGTGRR